MSTPEQTTTDRRLFKLELACKGTACILAALSIMFPYFTF